MRIQLDDVRLAAPIPRHRRRSMRAIRLAVLAAALFATSALAGARDDLTAFTKGLKGLDGQFTQQVLDANGKLKESSSGRCALSAPRLFRWEYTKPYAQLIVADGKRVWVYDPDLQQVTRRPQGSRGAEQPACGADRSRQARTQDYILDDAGTKDGLDWLTLTPRNGDAERVQHRRASASTRGSGDDAGRRLAGPEDDASTSAAGSAIRRFRPELPVRSREGRGHRRRGLSAADAIDALAERAAVRLIGSRFMHGRRRQGGNECHSRFDRESDASYRHASMLLVGAGSIAGVPATSVTGTALAPAAAVAHGGRQAIDDATAAALIGAISEPVRRARRRSPTGQVHGHSGGIVQRDLHGTGRLQLGRDPSTGSRSVSSALYDTEQASVGNPDTDARRRHPLARACTQRRSRRRPWHVKSGRRLQPGIRTSRRRIYG